MNSVFIAVIILSFELFQVKIISNGTELCTPVLKVRLRVGVEFRSNAGRHDCPGQLWKS